MATRLSDVQWNMPYRQVVPSYSQQQKQLAQAGWSDMTPVGIPQAAIDVSGVISLQPACASWSDMTPDTSMAAWGMPTGGDPWNDRLRVNSLAARNVQAPAATLSPLVAQAINNPTIPMVEAQAPASIGLAQPTTANPMSGFSNLGGSEFTQGLADNATDYNAAIGMSGNTTPTGMLGSFMEQWGKYGKPLIGTAQDPGPLSVGLGIGQGLFNVGLGLKNYNLAKDSLNFQKEAFAKNYGAQKENLVEDRGWQAARQAAREGKDYNAAKASAMADWGKRLA